MTEREYNTCVNQYADNVYRFIVKNLRHEEDARDIVQTAFEKLWRNRETVETEKSKSFLFTVAYNQMIDHIRKNKRVSYKEEFSEDAKIGHQVNSNTKKALMEALDKLSDTPKKPDEELSATEQQAVDAFVDQHPDLKEELEMLQQTKLLPEDALTFTDKSSLFKNVGEEVINSANYEEKFLLYVDDELGNKDKAAVETFVLQHPQFQEAFTLLQQTRLEQEIIPHPDKTELYRKEEEEKPVIYLRWWKIAVAAVVIGLGIALWTLLPQAKNTGNDGFANKGNSPAQRKSTAGVVPADQSNPAVQSHSSERNAVASTEPANKEKDNSPIVTGKRDGHITGSNTITTQQAAAKDNNDMADITPATKAHNGNDLPAPEPRKNNTTMASVVDDPTDVPLHSNDMANPKPRNNNIISAAVSNSNNNNSIAKPQAAVYKELNTDDEDKSLYVGSIELNKDKLRGLARKVGRLFGNKSKTTDDDKTIMVSNR
ncbi:hypothetical protein F5148DRAFT_1379317 [Russula earlei]|uniref:Uncharacterized protein n=1 Tax=Russula earlei TaxID=71964 RepID=A0ACC0TUB3_9AGAM|nr:hypothetical protein F5148DRAFT_1379317 [Russula earlei]